VEEASPLSALAARRSDGDELSSFVTGILSCSHHSFSSLSLSVLSRVDGVGIIYRRPTPYIRHPPPTQRAMESD